MKKLLAVLSLSAMLVGCGSTNEGEAFEPNPHKKYEENIRIKYKGVDGWIRVVDNPDDYLVNENGVYIYQGDTMKLLTGDVELIKEAK